jgi:hypothetical protein
LPTSLKLHLPAASGALNADWRSAASAVGSERCCEHLSKSKVVTRWSSKSFDLCSVRWGVNSSTAQHNPRKKLKQSNHDKQ